MVQQTALRYWCFHYLKRIGETFFLHRSAPLQDSTLTSCTALLSLVR